MSIVVSGQFAKRFQSARKEFERNFTERHEIGAAFCVFQRGECVIDLWGGSRDPAGDLPWTRETMVPVFSVTKGMAAASIHLARLRGLIDLEKPVCEYWPEFQQAGKKNITVRQLLGHEAGLPVISRCLSPAIIGQREILAGILAAQHPAWKPGSRHGYHAVTLGWYESELIRRIDSKHRSIARFFQEEIALPLGASFYLRPCCPLQPGPPLAELKDYLLIESFLHWRRMPPALLCAAAWPFSLSARAITNPFVFRPAHMVTGAYEDIEIPSVNGVGSALAIAQIYSELSKESSLFGNALGELAQPFRQPGFDVVLRTETAFLGGFMKPCGTFLSHSTPAAFGMPGLGGSLGFADPTYQMGYAYVTNRMDFYPWSDPREVALRTAVYQNL